MKCNESKIENFIKLFIQNFISFFENNEEKIINQYYMKFLNFLGNKNVKWLKLEVIACCIVNFYFHETFDFVYFCSSNIY